MASPWRSRSRIRSSEGRRVWSRTKRGGNGWLLEWGEQVDVRPVRLARERRQTGWPEILYDLIRSRRLRMVKIGKRRLVPVDALPEVIALLVEEESAA